MLKAKVVGILRLAEARAKRLTGLVGIGTAFQNASLFVAPSVAHVPEDRECTETSAAAGT
jgi:hypothetical protein